MNIKKFTLCILTLFFIFNHFEDSFGHYIMAGEINLESVKSKISDVVPADISGQVTDDNGEPLIGVNIQVQGTNNGTSTDMEGRYNLDNVAEEAILVFSYVGYQSQEVPVDGRTSIDIQMASDAQLLDELVVVGYGTVKKSDLTGSVQRIEGETFEDQSMTQLSDMLTGTVAGFYANQGTSAAGGSSLEVRGPTSLNANTEPLIVLDGVIYNGNLSDIAPSDIESIDILKDASSAAVYGSRAASGVIIVTTRKGSVGKPTISFSTDVGLAEVTNKDVRPLNPMEYTTFRRDLLTKENPDQPQYYYYDPANLPSDINQEEWLNLNANPNSDVTREWLNRLLFFNEEVESYLAGAPIDWYDRTMQTGMRQNYDLSISGGLENIQYYWSLGYTQNEGVVVGDEYGTFRTRLNLNSDITDFLDVGLNAQFASRDESSVSANLGDMLTSSPYGFFNEPDGSVKWYPNGYALADNALINHLLQERLRKVNTFFGSAYANVKLPLGISYKISFNPRLGFGNNYNFWPSTTPNGASSHSMGYGTRNDSKNFEWMVDNLLKWNGTYGAHNFDVTFLYNREKFQRWSSSQSGESFAPNENLTFNALQFATNYLVENDDEYSTGDAIMGRINYTLSNKYLLTASVRRDGYSAFGQGSPRAVFPAGAFAWKISEEDFINDNVFTQLKLRLSWGINGNREIGRYAALARLNQNIYSNGSRVLIGVFNSSLANPNLVWEKTEAYNIGVDFGILNGRLNGSVDVYDMTTNDLLMERNLPRITGFNDITTNLGELQNRGFELTLNSVNMDRPNFEWSSNFVFSLNRNKIVHLFGDFEEVEVDGETVRREISDITNEWFIGQAIDRIWNYNITGVWQESEEDEAKAYGLAPGDYKAEDTNGDGAYSALDDKQFIGWRRPRYRIGLRNSMTFLQNFNLSVFIRGDLGQKGGITEFKHNNSNLYDRQGMRRVPYWTAENPSDRYGSLTAASSAYGGGYNVFFDRSFVRIQDVSLSYAIPEVLASRMKLQNLKVFASIRNLYSFDQWEDWDPESGGSPMPRIFTVGLDLSL